MRPTGIRLPPLLVLTDRNLCAPRPLTDVVAGAVSGGARAVILREKDLPHDERADLASELRPILSGAGGCLIVASDPTIESDGIHLAAVDPFPDPRPAMVGRSCHSPAEVRKAEAEGCDYVTVSPVYPTPTKPGYGPPIGEDAAKAICLQASLPVFVLGGVTAARASRAFPIGAAGVAVMGAVMGSVDPHAAVHDLLEALAPGRPAQPAQLAKGKAT